MNHTNFTDEIEQVGESKFWDNPIVAGLTLIGTIIIIGLVLYAI